MIAALILLAEATASCGLPGSDRLGGGAVLVRPVGTVERVPFQRLGPATDIRGAGGKIHQTQATPEAGEEPDADRPAEQCEAAALPIV